MKLVLAYFLLYTDFSIILIYALWKLDPSS